MIVRPSAQRPTSRMRIPPLACLFLVSSAPSVRTVLTLPSAPVVPMAQVGERAPVQSEVSLQTRVVAHDIDPVSKTAQKKLRAFPEVGKGEFYDVVRMVEDGDGNLHVVFIEDHVEIGRDYLGNRQRWSSTIYHLERIHGVWTQPRRIYHNALLCITGLQLLINRKGTLVLVMWGYNNGIVTTEGGCPPGHYQVLVTWSSGATWAPPFPATGVDAKLLHDCDACYDAEDRLHLAWAPWPYTQRSESIHHRVLLEHGWGREELLPAENICNCTNPVVRRWDDGLHIFCLGQTFDSSKINLFERKLGDARSPWVRLLSSSDFCYEVATASPVVCVASEGATRWDVDFRFATVSDSGEVHWWTEPVLCQPLTDTTGAAMASAGTSEWVLLGSQQGRMTLFLVRGGELEGSHDLSPSGSGSPRPRCPQIVIDGSRFVALWAGGDHRDTLYSVCGDLSILRNGLAK